MNKVKFFIASVQLDYVIRFYAKAEAIVAEYRKRYPDYLFHVKKLRLIFFVLLLFQSITKKIQ